MSTAATSLSVLASARYGKDKVRVLRVVRNGKWHHVVEYNVTAMLEGDIISRWCYILLYPRSFSTEI